MRGLNSHTHFIDGSSTYDHAHEHEGKHAHPDELDELRRQQREDEIEERFVAFLQEDAPELLL